MEMEVMIPSPAVDFNFDSACTTPYISAPSSPQRFGNFFFSAPTSPTSSSSFFREELDAFSADADATSGESTIPFSWEEKPGIPKIKDAADENDFQFDFSGQLEKTSLSAADELFDGGKIKPLKPPPRLQFGENGVADSPRSPRSPTGMKNFKEVLQEALSPRRKKNDFDPFAAAMEQTCRGKNSRGRERTFDPSNSSSRRQKGTRSLSPFRVRDIFFTKETDRQSSSSSTSSKNSTSSKGNNRKWSLKDLFRSASEGHAPSKEPLLKKYSLLKRTSNEDVKNSSFRSTDSAGSVSRRRRRGPGGGPVSAHEMHYTANRAVSEEMRRKTFLPYNHGLLGCLGFNPAVRDISRGIRSMTRG